MKIQTAVAATLLTLLTGCGPDASVENQKRIHTLTQENETLKKSEIQYRAEEDSLARTLKTLEDSLVQCDILLHEESKLRRIQKLLPLQMALACTEVYGENDTVSALTNALIFGKGDQILLHLSHETGWASYTVAQRLEIARGRLSSRDNFNTSKSHRNSPEKYYFEYLADCVGRNIEFGDYADALGSSENWILQFLRKNLTSDQRDLVIDQVTDNIFTILEYSWKEDRPELYRALDYVLATTASLDYSAKTGEHGEFLNENYEKNWNGIQKFFFRTEYKFPGSAERVRDNIRNYLKRRRG